MTVRTRYDRYVEFGSTLGNTVKRIDRAVSRGLARLVGWSEACWKARNATRQSWPA